MNNEHRIFTHKVTFQSHLLWIHFLHFKQQINIPARTFSTYPTRIIDFTSIFAATWHFIVIVFLIFTPRPFLSMPSFKILLFTNNRSRDSEIRVMSEWVSEWVCCLWTKIWHVTSNQCIQSLKCKNNWAWFQLVSSSTAYILHLD